MTKKLGNSPTPQQAAQAWTRGFAAAVRNAADGGERLTKKQAKEMTGPFADNAVNFFERTGRSSSKLDTIIESGARYAKRELEGAAGDDKKLSAVDVRSLPKDLSSDILELQGKKVPKEQVTKPSESLQNAVGAVNHDSLSSYGKTWWVDTFPADKSRADILRQAIGYDDLSDAEAEQWFDKTTGKSGVTGFVSTMEDVAQQEYENRDDDSELPGGAAKKLIEDFGAAVKTEMLPVSKFKGVEYLSHGIAEDGDTELHLLLAQQKNGSWTAVGYSDFPF